MCRPQAASPSGALGIPVREAAGPLEPEDTAPALGVAVPRQSVRRDPWCAPGGLSRRRRQSRPPFGPARRRGRSCHLAPERSSPGPGFLSDSQQRELAPFRPPKASSFQAFVPTRHPGSASPFPPSMAARVDRPHPAPGWPVVGATARAEAHGPGFGSPPRRERRRGRSGRAGGAVPVPSRREA